MFLAASDWKMLTRRYFFFGHLICTSSATTGITRAKLVTARFPCSVRCLAGWVQHLLADPRFAMLSDPSARRLQVHAICRAAMNRSSCRFTDQSPPNPFGRFPARGAQWTDALTSTAAADGLINSRDTPMGFTSLGSWVTAAYAPQAYWTCIAGPGKAGRYSGSMSLYRPGGVLAEAGLEAGSRDQVGLP